MPSKQTTSKDIESRAKTRDGAIALGCKIIENWDNFTRPRLNAIREMELSYYGQVRPTLKGRSNFPFPVLAKYIDAMKARLDDLPVGKLENNRRAAQYNVVQQAQSALTLLKKPTRGDWARYDRIGRINSLFAGYCAMEFSTEIDENGTFQAWAKPIDHNDFVFEPLMGSDLEQHKAIGKYPLFKTEDDLNAGVESGIYDRRQVDRLLKTMSAGGQKKNGENLMGRFARYKALGLDVENNSYLGEKTTALAELQMNYKGKRWLVTFDPTTRIAVRFQPLKQVFSSGMYSIVLYQTHEDGNVVMCKSPADDIFPIAEGMRVKVNQMFDASTKQLWGQRIFDPRFFPDPSELEWRRPDQLIAGRIPADMPGATLATGIHQMENNFDASQNMEFTKWMDDFLATVVGVNPNDLTEDTKRVGVLFGQLAKSGSMMNIQNKSYSDMWQKGIQRILYGMHDNLDEALMVKTIGTSGVEWSEFSKKELGNPSDYDIVMESSTVEAEMNEALAQTQLKALSLIVGNPALIKEVNPRAMNEQLLKIGKLSDETITRLMDTKHYGKEKSIGRADMAIEEILAGKEPKVYPGADISFYEYILNFAIDMDENDEKDTKQKLAILYYGKKHREIVIKNAARQAVEEQAMKEAEAAASAPADAQKPALPAPAGGKPSDGVVPEHIVARTAAAGLPPAVEPPPSPIPANPGIPAAPAV